MTVTITNLRYAAADNTLIDMDVTGWQSLPTIPFTYHSADQATLSLVVKDWLAANQPQIAAYVPPSPSVPQSVTRAQAKIQLFRAGLLPAVKAAVAQAGGETALWFDEALNWSRNDARIATIAGALGLNDAQVDALFIAASAIA